MSAKNNKLEKLITKHKPLTKEQIKQTFQKIAETKKEITLDAEILEQNLKNFNKITDPLIDPETETPLCWIKRPTNAELESFFPPELLEYKNCNLEDIPVDVLERNNDLQFEIMANLITVPKHDAKWWKANANQVFQRLFNLHIEKLLENLGVDTNSFR